MGQAAELERTDDDDRPAEEGVAEEEVTPDAGVPDEGAVELEGAALVGADTALAEDPDTGVEEEEEAELAVREDGDETPDDDARPEPAIDDVEASPALDAPDTAPAATHAPPWHAAPAAQSQAFVHGGAQVQLTGWHRSCGTQSPSDVQLKECPDTPHPITTVAASTVPASAAVPLCMRPMLPHRAAALQPPFCRHVPRGCSAHAAGPNIN